MSACLHFIVQLIFRNLVHIDVCMHDITSAYLSVHVSVRVRHTLGLEQPPAEINCLGILASELSGLVFLKVKCMNQPEFQD